MAFVCNEAYDDSGKYYPMKDTVRMTEKLTLFFFLEFLGVFHHLE